MKTKSALKSIRAKCLDCSCNSSPEVKKCPVYDCALWPFRFGVMPSTAKRRYGDELLTIPKNE